MKRSGYTALALVVIAVCSGPGAARDVCAQAFGIISATVERSDDARGLTVRSEPSASGQPVGFLPLGTEIKSRNEFRDGWVKLEIPSKGNWVNMAFLKPNGGEATVAAVDKPDLCLAIRKGPYSSYEKVGCAELGQKLKLSGVWSATNWARLEDGGWVDASKIETDLLVCATPLVEAPAPEPQTLVEPQAEVSAQTPVLPSEVPAPPCVSSDYSECPPYGVSSAPLCYGGPGGPIFYGDFGGFGYFPGAFPFVSIAVGSYGGYYHRHHRGWPHDRHHGDPGHNRAYNRGTTRGSIASTRVNRGAASLNTNPRNFSTNRSLANASNTLRSARTGPSVSRGAFSSTALRSTRSTGFRSASFFRGRGTNVASFAGRGFRTSSFRGAGFRGASFRGGGHHGGGHRR